MRVLFFVVKMIVVVLLIGFVVKMVSTAVFRPKPIETIPDRYAHEAAQDVKVSEKGSTNINPIAKVTAEETAEKAAKNATNIPGSIDEELTLNPGKDILLDLGSGININDYLKEKGLTRLIPEKYISMLERLTLKDKLTGISLFAKINTSDQEQLFNVMKDGVNQDEYDNVNEILKRNLDDKDFVKLREIVSRYTNTDLS